MNILSNFKEDNVGVFTLATDKRFHQLRHKISMMRDFVSRGLDLVSKIKSNQIKDKPKSKLNQIKGFISMIKKSFFTFLFSLFFLEFGFSQLQPGFKRPVIDARAEDRPKILAKVARYAWAKKAFDKIINGSKILADRHVIDPDYVLSRMAMHWKTNERYTDVDRSDAGWGSSRNGGRGVYGDHIKLSSRRGNAPVPTPRWRYGIWETTNRHTHHFGFPRFQDRVPYVGDTLKMKPKSGYSHLGFHITDPVRVPWDGYNLTFTHMARNAARAYWLTGEEKYAKLAADIVMQFIRGASYMNRPRNFYANQAFFTATIEDAFSWFFNAYDLIYDYLMEHNDEYYYDKRYVNPKTGYYYPTSHHPATQEDPGRDMRYIDTNTGKESIELMVDAWAYKYGKKFVQWGGVGNNWEMVETEYISGSAMAISDNNKPHRLELVSYLLDRPHRSRKDFGQNPIPTQLEKYFNERGMVREPLNYHAYPTGRFTRTINILENAGYAIMNDPRFVRLFRAMYIATDYLFPHGLTTAFGDGDAGGQRPDLLETAYKYARKYNHPEKERILYELYKLMNQGYRRSGDIFSTESQIEPRPITKIKKNLSDHVDFAKHYIQRNGLSELEGMMYSIGANGRYSHSGNSGLTIELYGKGYTLVPDSGYGGWGRPRFERYTKNAGSHNTVVIGERRPSSRNYANLVTMDPPLEAKTSVSKNNSFSLVNYTYAYSFCGPDANGNRKCDDDEKETESYQQTRGIMMNRTARNSGYYFDVFWSEGNEKTDYLCHSPSGGLPNATFKQDGVIKRGESVSRDGELSSTTEEGAPGSSQENIVYNVLYNKKKYTTDKDLQVGFKLDLNRSFNNRHLRGWIMGEGDRSYYSAGTTYSDGIKRHLRKYSNSVMVIRDKKPNYDTKPFVILYEPYRGDGKGVIDHVRRMDGTKGRSHYVGIVVSNSDRNGQDRPDIQYLISSKANNVAFNHEGVLFKGYSATVSHNDGELTSLYLGKGSYLSNHGYRLEKTGNNDITAYLEMEGKTMTLTSQDDTKVTLSYRNDNRAIAYTNLGLYYKYKGSSELRSATEQSVVPNDGVTTIGSGTIIANIPNTDKKEVLLLPLEKKDYSGVNAKPNLRVYHNGVVSRRRVLFDDDSEISLLINSPTGFSAENLIIKKGNQGNRILGEGEYEVESLSFGSARVHFRNVPALESGLYKVSFTVPGDGYTRKEYNVSLVRTTSSTRLVKVYPNPYKYGEHDELNIEYFIPRNADKSKYVLLMVNILGDEMDSVPMSSVLDNVGKVYWDTFMVRNNYKPGLYMIALTDKKKRKVYDRKYILVEK